MLPERARDPAGHDAEGQLEQVGPAGRPDRQVERSADGCRERHEPGCECCPAGPRARGRRAGRGTRARGRAPARLPSGASSRRPRSSSLDGRRWHAKHLREGTGEKLTSSETRDPARPGASARSRSFGGMTLGKPPDSSPAAPRPRLATKAGARGAAAAALSVLCAAWVLRLWRGDLGVPLRYTPVDDTKFYLMLVKGIVDHGWYATNPSLGAPFGQQLVDYPQGADSLNLLLIRFLALFSSNPALIINLFFLGTFALCAFTAHLVLRVLGSALSPPASRRSSSRVLAYHFFRGESHLFLSAYYAVPLTAYLFLRVLGGEAALRTAAAQPGTGSSTWASRRTALTLLICVVIGSDNLYYATFAVVMLVGGALIGALVRRRLSFLQGLAVAALIAATVTVNLAPSLAYQHEHGANAALERSLAGNESSNEAFALRLSNLLLPAPNARIAPLRDATEEYDHAIAPGYCEACYASLGTVGDIGFIWLIAVRPARDRRPLGAHGFGPPVARCGHRRLARARGRSRRRPGEPDRTHLHTRPARLEQDLGADRVLLADRRGCAARRAQTAPFTRAPRERSRPVRRSPQSSCSASTTRPATPISLPMPPPRGNGAATNGSCARSKRGCPAARASSSSPTSRFPRAIRKRP